MLSHDLAKLLLDLPNHEVMEKSEGTTEFEVHEGTVVDFDHPNFTPLQKGEPFRAWKERQPKKPVIFI
jgi:hypothetical protein